jgi:hypothetical protein
LKTPFFGLVFPASAGLLDDVMHHDDQAEQIATREAIGASTGVLTALADSTLRLDNCAR